MGYCVDWGDDNIGIEIRRESISLHEDDVPREEQNIFGHDHHVEIGKETLLKVLKFFDDPKNRERAFGPELMAKYASLIPDAEKYGE